MWSIYTSEFSEKTFFEVGQLHYQLQPLKIYIYNIYIAYFLKLPKLQNEVAQLQIFFIFHKFCICSLTYISKLARGSKLAEIRSFEFECQELQIFVHENVLNYYTCVIYILQA